MDDEPGMGHFDLMRTDIPLSLIEVSLPIVQRKRNMCQTNEYRLDQMRLYLDHLKSITEEVRGALDRDFWSPSACDSAMISAYHVWAETGDIFAQAFKQTGLTISNRCTEEESIQLEELIEDYTSYLSGSMAEIKRKLDAVNKPVIKSVDDLLGKLVHLALDIDEEEDEEEKLEDFNWPGVFGDAGPFN